MFKNGASEDFIGGILIGIAVCTIIIFISVLTFINGNRNRARNILKDRGNEQIIISRDNLCKGLTTAVEIVNCVNSIK